MEINASTDQAVQSITASLPKTVQEQLISANVAEVTIRSSNISIGLDLEALKLIQTTAGGDVNLSAAAADSTKLSAQAQAAIGGRPVYEFSLTYGDKTMSSFGNGSVSVAIPYTLQAGEVPGGLCAVYVDDGGGITYIDNSVYDTSSQSLRFSTNHFSTYGIAYRADAPASSHTMIPWVNAVVQSIQKRYGPAKKI